MLGESLARHPIRSDPSLVRSLRAPSSRSHVACARCSTPSGARAAVPGSPTSPEARPRCLEGWRSATVDLDLKLDPEPEGVFAAIARIKEELDVNVELGLAR